MKKIINMPVLMLMIFTLFSSHLFLQAQDQDPQQPNATTEANADATAEQPPEAVAETTTPAGSVQGIDFKYKKGNSNLAIKFDHEVQFEKINSDTDKQVILEFKNAKIASKFVRKLDTSSFKSNVVLVSPYQSGDNVRVVLQLKSMNDVEVQGDGKSFNVLIANNVGNGAESTAETTNVETSSPAAVESTAAAAEAGTDPTAPATDSVLAENTSEVPKPETKDGNIDEFIKTQETRNYVGRKIDLQMKDADLLDVFRIISEASEFNILLGSDVSGKVTMNLNQVPWDQALDILLKTNKLVAERSGNVLRVVTLDSMTKEKQAELANKKAVDAVEPLVVKIFPISYAKIDELKKILDDFLSQDAAQVSALSSASGQATAAAAAAGKRGSIQIDSRTNSLVVRDTASSIEKIKRIIAELDTQTPQILIEGKFVEVQENRIKDIKGRLFITSRAQGADTGLTFPNIGQGKANYASAFSGGSSTPLVDAFAAGLTNSVGSFGFSPPVGIIPGINDEIAAFLNIMETEANAKIIATPRVITQNKETAEIAQGQTLAHPGAPGANAAAALQEIKAMLTLKVTPQVTSDGSINLKITFSQVTPSNSLGSGPPSTDDKKVDTNVLIESGSTLVIGGVYSSFSNKSRSGIPILRDIPLIGWLFGDKSETNSKNELFIFLTPRVVNEKESGISG